MADANEELKVLLRENIAISKETLNILQKINRARITAGILRALKWFVVIGVSLGSYYYVEPYVSKYFEIIRDLSSGVENIGKVSNNINSALPAADLLKKLQGIMPK